MFTYFILNTDSFAIKIGSSRDPIWRLGQIQVGSPADLILLGVCEQDETEIQKRFKHLWLRGEWYVAAADLTRWIAENAKQLSPEEEAASVEIDDATKKAFASYMGQLSYKARVERFGIARVREIARVNGRLGGRPRRKIKVAN